MLGFRNGRHSSNGAFYCRFDNRLVGSCPRSECMESCPLRLDCPAFQKAFQPAVSPPEVHPRG